MIAIQWSRQEGYPAQSVDDRLLCVLCPNWCGVFGTWGSPSDDSPLYDCRPAPQHVMSWHLSQIGREAARVAGAPMTVAYGPANHAYEVAASAEGPVGRGGRSRQIASFGGGSSTPEIFSLSILLYLP